MTQSSGPSWQLFWVSTMNSTLLFLSGVPSRTKSESRCSSLAPRGQRSLRGRSKTNHRQSDNKAQSAESERPRQPPDKRLQNPEAEDRRWSAQQVNRAAQVADDPWWLKAEVLSKSGTCLTSCPPPVGGSVQNRLKELRSQL